MEAQPPLGAVLEVGIIRAFITVTVRGEE